MEWWIVAYYTGHRIYHESAKKLIGSLNALGLNNYIIKEVKDLGSWQSNTQFKPGFLRHMLDECHPKSLVYVDVDAIFERYPALFDDLDKWMPEVNIAAHVLDHSKFRRKTCAPELLSGTLYIKNTFESKQIIEEWIDKCSENPGMWDQVALAQVLSNHKFYLLPERYCCIFDYMASVPDKVIVHYQASRVAKSVTPVIKKPQNIKRIN